MIDRHVPVDLILGSQSPRRRELIQLLGLPVSSYAAEADEASITEPNPAVNVVETAVLKADLLSPHLPLQPNRRSLLITADTTVALERQMLNKPADEDEAKAMLVAMRNRTHEVHTGYVVQDLGSGKRIKGVHTAVVTMRNYTDAEIDAYIASGDPMDKAGAYAIQHPTFRPVAALSGCFLSVMGLPLCNLLTVLEQLAVPLPLELTAVQQQHQHYPCPTLQKHLTKIPPRNF